MGAQKPSEFQQSNNSGEFQPIALEFTGFLRSHRLELVELVELLEFTVFLRSRRSGLVGLVDLLAFIGFLRSHRLDFPFHARVP